MSFTSCERATCSCRCGWTRVSICKATGSSTGGIAAVAQGGALRPTDAQRLTARRGFQTPAAASHEKVHVGCERARQEARGACPLFDLRNEFIFTVVEQVDGHLARDQLHVCLDA